MAMINLFYIALSVVFVAVMLYMVLYNRSHKTYKPTQQNFVKPPAKADEGIVGSTEADELRDRR